MSDYLGLATLLFSILNPFMMSVYLVDLISEMGFGEFARVMVRASMISSAVFVAFAIGGDAIFTDVLHVHFGSFQLFGGIIFVIIGLRFVFQGVESIRSIRGDPEHLAGAIAMPFMIGPGTVSASVVIGGSTSITSSVLIIVGTIATTLIVLLILKWIHDYVRERNARLVGRYIEIVGRISALVIGTIAIEMIYQGASALMAQ